MKRFRIAALALLFISASAYSQNDSEKDLPTVIGEMVETLGKDLKLEDWQLFKMDSTLMYNYTQLNAEMDNLRKAGVYNNEIYMMTSDKWTDAVDTTFQRHILNAKQWEKYLKSDFGRQKRARDKRMALRVEKGIAR